MIRRVALWLIATAAALVPWPAPLIERAYARGWFPWVQVPLTTLSNTVPFAVFDLLLVAVVAGVAVLTVRDLRAPRLGWAARGLRLVARLATVAATAYLAFLACWGLNYRRVPLEQRIDFDRARISHDALIDLAQRSVFSLNALYEPAHRQSWPRRDQLDQELAAAFVRAQQQLGNGRRFVAARPKRTTLDWYFRRAGVAGMTDPYLLETLVATDLLAVERPMVIAHEWSHLAGIADEGEANFSGWLACLNGSPYHQYSGWLFLYGEVADDLAPGDLRRIAGTLADGPRADLRAIRDRLLKNLNPTVSAAGWRVYDQYLKANRIDAGTRSYGQVVRLVLGTPYDDHWSRP